MAEFAKLIETVRGTEYAPIKFEVSDDLSHWSAEIPGKVVAKCSFFFFYFISFRLSSAMCLVVLAFSP
jgi:hypothetical protein